MMYELGRDPMTNYVECLECGTDNLAGHVVGCNTGTGSYQIVRGDAVIGHAFNEHGLYQALGEIRLELGKLAGVHVYDTNGTKLKAKAVADLLYDYAWNGAK
jgi:hypothetical protein